MSDSINHEISDNMNHEWKTQRYTAECVIDPKEITDFWASEWNETPETCTEEWKLAAFLVLATSTGLN